MTLPEGPNQAGFYCHRRVFQVPVKLAEKSNEDRNQNIVRMCMKLREQVWGTDYPTVNKDFAAWCEGQSDRSADGLCPKLEDVEGGKRVKDVVPFMKLSREELLYFYGHQELYCRADRDGLVHQLFNDTWAPSFLCDVPRGVMEA